MRGRIWWFAAGLVIAAVVFVVIDLRYQRMQSLYESASLGDAQALKTLAAMDRPVARQLVQQLAVAPETDANIRVAAFDVIGSDPARRVSLCRYVGESNGALDEQAEDLFLDRIAGHELKSRECLTAVLQRLIDLPFTESPLVSRAVFASRSSAAETEVEQLRERTVAVLRQHTDAVAEILRTRYKLGTDQPEPAALPAVMALHLKESCPDLERSRRTIEANGGLYAEDYRDAAGELCAPGR
jgi:hypothetical protein